MVDNKKYLEKLCQSLKKAAYFRERSLALSGVGFIELESVIDDSFKELIEIIKDTKEFKGVGLVLFSNGNYSKFTLYFKKFPDENKNVDYKKYKKKENLNFKDFEKAITTFIALTEKSLFVPYYIKEKIEQEKQDTLGKYVDCEVLPFSKYSEFEKYWNKHYPNKKYVQKILFVLPLIQIEHENDSDFKNFIAPILFSFISNLAHLSHENELKQKQIAGSVAHGLKNAWFPVQTTLKGLSAFDEKLFAKIIKKYNQDESFRINLERECDVYYKDHLKNWMELSKKFKVTTAFASEIGTRIPWLYGDTRELEKTLPGEVMIGNVILKGFVYGYVIGIFTILNQDENEYRRKFFQNGKYVKPVLNFEGKRILTRVNYMEAPLLLSKSKEKSTIYDIFFSFDDRQNDVKKLFVTDKFSEQTDYSEKYNMGKLFIFSNLIPKSKAFPLFVVLEELVNNATKVFVPNYNEFYLSLKKSETNNSYSLKFVSTTDAAPSKEENNKNKITGIKAIQYIVTNILEGSFEFYPKQESESIWRYEIYLNNLHLE